MTPLGRMLFAYRQKHDIEAKALAEQIGIGASTLARLETGKLPDAHGLAKIITWLVSEGLT